MSGETSRRDTIYALESYLKHGQTAVLQPRAEGQALARDLRGQGQGRGQASGANHPITWHL